MERYLFFTAAYLIGSIPFSFLLAFLCSKKDLRKVGSGNIGATNLYRVCGLKFALLGFLLDFSKGFFTLYFLNKIFNVSELTLVLSGFFAVLGHVFPVYLKFKGGKGVSTTAGILCFLDYRIFVIVLVFFWIVFMFKRIVSLSSILSSMILILLSVVFLKHHLLSIERVVFMVLIGFMVILFHKDNIQRILSGREKTINER